MWIVYTHVGLMGNMVLWSAFKINFKVMIQLSTFCLCTLYTVYSDIDHAQIVSKHGWKNKPQYGKMERVD